MSSKRLQVVFHDSSDEDASHTAAIAIVPDGAEREDAGDTQAEEGWVSNMMLRGVGTIAGAITGGNANLPYGDDASPTQRDKRDSQRSLWGYGAFTSSSSSTHKTLSDADRYLAYEDDLGPSTYEVDLRDAILQYQVNPSELCLSLILATLRLPDTRVDGYIMGAAAGNPFLVKTLLDSERTELNDPEVQAIIQIELDHVLSGNVDRGEFVDALQADYLHCLCRVPSSRITHAQMVLLRYSGFEFIKILYDYPHVISDNPPPNRATRIAFRSLKLIATISSWVGLLVYGLFSTAMVYSAVYWFEENNDYRNNGYWTVITYGGGFVASLVTTLMVQKGKLSRYDEQIWPHPDANLKTIPIIPVYEAALVYTAFRYRLTPERKRFFIIRYDLRNSIATEQVHHTLFHALPQIVLQSFLFTEKNEYRERPHYGAVPFWLMVGACIASFVMTVFLVLHQAMFSHSCNRFGFALMALNSSAKRRPTTTVSHTKRRIMPTDLITAVLFFFYFAFFITAAVTIFIVLVNLGNCDGGAISFVGIYVGVVGVSTIAYLCLLSYVPMQRSIGFVGIPMLIMEICFLAYTTTKDYGKKPHIPDQDLCSLFVYAVSGWTIPNLVNFGCSCIFFLAWASTCLYEVITGCRLEQTCIDAYIRV